MRFWRNHTEISLVDRAAGASDTQFIVTSGCPTWQGDEPSGQSAVANTKGRTVAFLQRSSIQMLSAGNSKLPKISGYAA